VPEIMQMLPAELRPFPEKKIILFQNGTTVLAARTT